MSVVMYQGDIEGMSYVHQRAYGSQDLAKLGEDPSYRQAADADKLTMITM